MIKDFKKLSLGIVGATGLVGRKLLEIIGERYQFKNIFVSASEKSDGKILEIGDKKYTLGSIEGIIAKKPYCVIFASSAEVSKKWAPVFVKNGICVIDNSSQWRMDRNVKLIVPEINGYKLTKDDFLIANPNCSTIQLAIILKPLHDALNIKRVIVSTYQAVSGGGYEALKQLFIERKRNVLGKNIAKLSEIIGRIAVEDADLQAFEEFFICNEYVENDIKKVYPYNIDMNIIPHIDTFLDNGYTKEELKIINETKKILDDNKIKISATAVRVPVENVHCESVNIEFKNPAMNGWVTKDSSIHKNEKQDFKELSKSFTEESLQGHVDVQKVVDILSKSKGIEVLNDINQNKYPMPCNSDGSDLVKVGRIRMDLDLPNTINLWIVADNLRKGAATNALQIVEIMAMLKY